MIDLALDGIACIVTGGTRGIGRDVVGLLLSQGARVVTSGVRTESIEALRSELADHADRLEVVRQDMADDDAGHRLVDRCVARFGVVDVVVNNAASFDAKDPAAVGSADWSGLLDLKLIGYWRVVQAAVPAMSGRGGAVTNVAGTAGVHASPMVPHVGATNAAIISASESWALALAPAGIRVNVVSPGLTATDRFKASARQRAAIDGTDLETASRTLATAVPVGHAADSAEVALSIVMLSSPVFRSVTGAHLIVDGAATLGLRRRA